MSGLFTILIVLLLAITAAAFAVCWTIVRCLAGLGRLLFGLGERFSLDPRRCPNARCLAENASDARFCRRCGGSIPTQPYAVVEHASAG